MTDPPGPIPAVPSFSDVKAILLARGFRPRRSLGQNFLHDPGILRFIVEAADLGPADAVLEVGTGPGLLTSRLAAAAGQVLSVEIDSLLHEVAARLLAPLENVRLLRADVLTSKGEVSAEVLRSIPAPGPEGATKHVSNLPYAVAVPLIVGLLEGPVRFERMVLTVQREIAERLTAGPGTRDWGPASVLVGLLADVETLRRLPAGAFWPAPKVESSVIRILPRRAPEEVEDYHGFKAFLRGVFTHRRKTALRALLHHLGREAPRARGEAILRSAGISADRRLEVLAVEELMGVYAASGRS